MRKAGLLVWLSIALCATAAADDLYRVTVRSEVDASRLSAAGVDPVVRLQSGYLVLAGESAVDRLQRDGLDVQLVADNLTRDELAIDGRMDRANVGLFPLLFEDGNLRLFRIASEELASLPQPAGLFPIGNRQPVVCYRETRPVDRSATALTVDLDSLISLVNQDSLQSYTERLQAFYRRVAGTDSSYVSRDWLASKLTSFGYDSVVIDSFVSDIGGVPTQCQNVIAYKVGTRFPDHHVIVGAHRDAVPGSPGADDNGSGSAAVLEMARVLKDIETDMTFLFILFDAEEYGLYGAWHYVDGAMYREDSIVYMLNMDMIAHYENSSQAKLFYGDDQTYSELWQTLADSLVGLTGVLSGSSGGSDHYPFAQNGFDVTFVHEYIFSTVYHSYLDSTSYMNFEYMTKMVKASLATAYVVSATAGPLPAVAFEYPMGVPEMLLPGVPTTFEVVVTGAWEGSPVPSSGQLHYSLDGGAYTSVPMTEITIDHYQATLPAADCDTRLAFYLSADETTSGTFYDPDTAHPYAAVVATSATTVFEDDFETDKGWTVYGDALDGHWDRGVPVGGGDRGDPPTDFDGSGSCYLTDNVDGNSDVDNGVTNLVSPAIDLSTGDAEIHYARWYSNHFGAAPFADVMTVYVRNHDTATWVLVETVGPVDQASGGWYVHSFWVGDFVTPTSQVQVLFAATDDGAGSVIEAGIDDFRVTSYQCETYGFFITTDSLPDWTIGQSYSHQLECTGGTGAKTWSDKHGDLASTGLSLSAAGLISGVPLDTGVIAFVARVVDGLDSAVERSFDMTINPVIAVATDSLPDGTEGEPYSFHLLSTGGTGTKTWTDKNGELDTTGLALAADGLLSGTPTVSGEISFTARVVDVSGSADERLFSVALEPAYVCGDVDGDGSTANVADLTYLVDFLFHQGPAPPVLAAANVDGLTGVGGPIDIADLTYLVDYLFNAGPAPVCE